MVLYDNFENVVVGDNVYIHTNDPRNCLLRGTVTKVTKTQLTVKTDSNELLRFSRRYRREVGANAWRACYVTPVSEWLDQEYAEQQQKRGVARQRDQLRDFIENKVTNDNLGAVILALKAAGFDLGSD
jgi:cytolysin (calcineurin-like family phosphatase)